MSYCRIAYVMKTNTLRDEIEIRKIQEKDSEI